MKEDIVKKIKPLITGWLRHDGETIYFYDNDKCFWASHTGNMAAMVLQRKLTETKHRISSSEAKAVLADIICDPDYFRPLERAPENLVNCENGILNLDKFTFMNSLPRYDFAFRLEFEYKDDADFLKCKTFSDFLCYVFGLEDSLSDQEKADRLNANPSVIRLLEMFGYMVSNEYRAKKLLVILGPANSGKSQLLELLRRVIGSDNTVALSLADLAGYGGGRFRTELLQKAHALINDELPTKGLRNLSELKKIIAGETITVEAKGMRPKTVKNTTKLMFAGNQLPELDEADCGNAFADRICPVVFKNAVPPEKKDVDLVDKLFEERSVIFSLALKFYGKMRQNHLSFTPDHHADEILRSYKEDNSSVITFVRDATEVKIGKQEEIHTNALFERYQVYCETASLSPVKSLKAFRQQLLSIPEISGIKKKRLQGDRNPCSVVLGVDLVKKGV